MRRRTPLKLEALEARALLSGLSYSLTTNQTSYQPGQPIVMTFTETNVSNQAITVKDGPSIDGFNVSQNGKLIWRSNAGPIPMYIRLDRLQPGQSLTVSALWNGVPTFGKGPVTGTVVITNQLDFSLSTTVSIATSLTSPSADPSSTPGLHPIGVITNPDPLPSPPITSTNAGNDPTTSTNGGNDPITGNPSAGNAGSAPIAISVSTNRPTYHAGQHVRMRITLENTGSSPVALPKASSGGLTVFHGSTPVWHRAHFAPKAVSHSHSLKPGQSVTLSTSWNGKVHQGGEPLAAGTYTLQASAGGSANSTTFQITG